jgi:hypothetical protein
MMVNSGIAYSSFLDAIGFLLVAALLFAPVVYLTGYFIYMTIEFFFSSKLQAGLLEIERPQDSTTHIEEELPFRRTGT